MDCTNLALPQLRINFTARPAIKRCCMGLLSAGLLSFCLPGVWAHQASAASGATHAQASVEKFDTRYGYAGDASAMPEQAYDDGAVTYIQLRAGSPLPRVFRVAENATLKPVAFVVDGTTLKIQSTHGRLVLQYADAQSIVMHLGGGRQDAPALITETTAGKVAYDPTRLQPRGTNTSMMLPPSQVMDTAKERNSYAVPLKGDRFVWDSSDATVHELFSHEVWFESESAKLSPKAKKALTTALRGVDGKAHFVITARDDPSHKSNLEQDRGDAIASFLVNQGFARERMTVKISGVGPSDEAGRNWASNLRVFIEPKIKIQPSAVDGRTGLATAASKAVEPIETNAALKEHVPKTWQTQPQGAQATSSNASAASSAAKPADPIFKATKDEYLKDILKRWARESSRSLEYQAEFNPRISADIAAADLKQAVQSVASQLSAEGTGAVVDLSGSDRMVVYQP